MPRRIVSDKTPPSLGDGLIPGARSRETIGRDNRPERCMSRKGPSHETRPRPSALSRPRPLSPYDRARDLPRLVPMWPGELEPMTPEKHHRLVQRLRRALREERRRGIAGSWTYDLARHARLYAALQAEMAAMGPPLSSWATATFRNTPARDLERAPIRAPEAGSIAAFRDITRDAYRGPSSSPAASGLPHSSAPPSDSRGEAATWRGTLPATSCNAFASDA